MTWRTRIRIALTTAVIGAAGLFLIATGCKHVLNEFRSGLSQADKGFPTHSAAEARRRGSLVAELTCTPGSFVADGSPLTIGECWIEQASEPVPHFVWWQKYELLDYYWLIMKFDGDSPLFTRVNRWRFQQSPSGFVVEVAAKRSVGRSKTRPTIPIKLILINPTDGTIDGRVEMGTFTLTSK